ncbi:MAG: ribosome biogenesis GTPase Der [Alphaproteobacteria bacterium]|nr:ribosome biogenesis GTPase Der [Alphaproteobacteria bacterium]
MKTVAIVGRTNVGKSTLFNKLCHKRLALVHDRPGVTRDRKEATATLKKQTFRLIDTAGLEKTTDLAKAMWEQTHVAIKEADIILMVSDARTEINALDRDLARELHKTHKPVILIANKCEGAKQKESLNDFYQLGLGRPLGLSAEHKIGFEELADILLPLIQESETKEESATERPLKLAIVGRPNVGKSTLINKMLGSNRLLTGPEAGVTRDAISVNWTWQDKAIQLTDTAGLRKFGKISDDLEKMSGEDTQTAIDFAEVVVLVLDINQPMERQDLLIASRVLKEGRCLVIALNKWDTVENPQKVWGPIKERMYESLQQVKDLNVIPVSAKTGYGINQLMEAVFKVYGLWNKRIPTHKLNVFLEMMKEAHPTPLAKNGRRVPLKYMTQVSTRPPTFVIFTTNPDKLPDSYIRYLSNGLRDEFGITGIPVRIQLRKRENPYAEKSKKSS